MNRADKMDWLTDFIQFIIEHLVLVIYFAIITAGFMIMLSIEQPYLQTQFNISLTPILSLLIAVGNIILLYGVLYFTLKPFNIDLDLSKFIDK